MTNDTRLVCNKCGTDLNGFSYPQQGLYFYVCVNVFCSIYSTLQIPEQHIENKKHQKGENDN